MYVLSFFNNIHNFISHCNSKPTQFNLIFDQTKFGKIYTYVCMYIYLYLVVLLVYVPKQFNKHSIYHINPISLQAKTYFSPPLLSAIYNPSQVSLPLENTNPS